MLSYRDHVQNAEDKDKKRRPWLWLLIGLLIFVVLFGCAQFAVLAGIPPSSVSIRSEIQADYGIWDVLHFAGLRPGIIAEAARDARNGGFNSTVAEGCFLPDEICEYETITPIVTAQSSPVITETIEPNPTEIQPTEIIIVAWIPPSDGGDEDDDEGSGGPPPPPTATPVTPTATPVTPTATPVYFSGEPDGIFTSIAPGSAIEIDISSYPIYVDETPNPDVDMIYYEREDQSNLGTTALDWISIELRQVLTDTWHMVFNWGDGFVDGNTNVDTFSADADGEQDNEPIPIYETPLPSDPTDVPLTPIPPLYGTPPFNTGIEIDVDAKAPPGEYDQIRLNSPPGGDGDAAEVDAIEVLPTPTSLP
jgi:hypothetical protein